MRWHHFEKDCRSFLIIFCCFPLQSGCFLVEGTKHEDKTSWDVSIRTGREWITARYMNSGYFCIAFSITVHVILVYPTSSSSVCYCITYGCTVYRYSLYIQRVHNYRVCPEVKARKMWSFGNKAIRTLLYIIHVQHGSSS